MKKLLIFGFLAFLLTACGSGLKISEEDMANVDHQVYETLKGIEENGNYYVTRKNEQYVFIDRIHRVDGDNAITLSELTFDVQQDVLNIAFSEEVISPDSSRDSVHQRLYKITGKGDYDTVLLTVNGKQLPFDGAFAR